MAVNLRVVQVSPLVVAELSVEMKALHQPILLRKGCKMHLSCFTGCRAIILCERQNISRGIFEPSLVCRMLINGLLVLVTDQPNCAEQGLLLSPWVHAVSGRTH